MPADYTMQTNYTKHLLSTLHVIHDELEVEGLVLVAHDAQVAQGLVAARRRHLD